jgi:dTDP-4-amino-4,6-dideoxygalactose transaminase
MVAIMDIAARHDLLVIEDAAQGLLADDRGRPLGGIGHMGTLSFHETKNIISGEGGALLLNDPRFVERAEIIWEKGTNRSQFFRGQVDKYTWVDLGSSYLPGELVAAFLWAQLQQAEGITRRRLDLWTTYHRAFADLESEGLVVRPTIPPGSRRNGHVYYLLLPSLALRTAFIERLKARGIQAVFHYVPLHSSPFGRSAGRTVGDMRLTEEVSERLVRLPLWVGLEEYMDTVIAEVIASVREVSAVTGAAG